MALVELVAGLESSAEALAVARGLGEAMGKRVIDAADGPGFLVNRCNRPFGLEALALLRERVADVPTIDRVVRLGGGFRMGPFELADLVGLDVGLEVARSFAELSFGEPRWRPSPLTAQLVAGGRLGRKSGRGWYRYEDPARPHRPPDPPPPDAAAPARAGSSSWRGTGRSPASCWRPPPPRASTRASPRTPPARSPGWSWTAAPTRRDPPAQGGPVAVLCADGSLAALDAGGGAVGFGCLPPFADCGLVELTRGSGTASVAAERAEALFGALGRHVAWVGDAPGLVLGRIVAQLVNEAAFAVGEGVGAPADVDAGMVLGLNHPRGPLAWGDRIGLDHVLGVLDGLWEERREERYRAAPLLRRLVLEGHLGVTTGRGFLPYADDDEGSCRDGHGPRPHGSARPRVLGRCPARPWPRRPSSACSTASATPSGATWSRPWGARPPTTASRRPSWRRCGPGRAWAGWRTRGPGS